MSLATVLVLLTACDAGGDAELGVLAGMIARRYVPSGPSARVLVDGLPPRLRARLPLPPGTEVLGTVSGDSSHVVFARTFADPRSVDAFFAEELSSRGWSPAGPRSLFCGADGLGLDASVDLRIVPPNDLRVSLSPRPACAPDRGAVPELPLDTLLPPPALPPPGRDDLRRCGGLAVGWSGRGVSGDLPADSILAHYGRQLEAAGWSELDDPTPGVAETWERDGVEGGSLRVTVTVIGAPGHPECSVALTRSIAWVGPPGRDGPPP